MHSTWTWTVIVRTQRCIAGPVRTHLCMLWSRAGGQPSSPSPSPTHSQVLNVNSRTLTWISVRIHTARPTRPRARPAAQCADASETRELTELTQQLTPVGTAGTAVRLLPGGVPVPDPDSTPRTHAWSVVMACTTLQSRVRVLYLRASRRRD